MRILLFLAWIVLTVGGSWHWWCKVRERCGPTTQVVETVVEEVPVAVPEPPTITPFEVNYEGLSFLSISDNLRFGKSAPMGRIPLEVNAALDSIATYLRLNPTKNLEITGQFHPSLETNDTEYSNLGLARADFIQQELVARGIDANRFIKSYDRISRDDFFTENDTLIGGVGLVLVDNDIATLESLMAEKPDLYFDSGSSYLQMTPQLRGFITQVIQYLNANPEQKLGLVGHTDSQGSANSNLRIGRERANTVKQYFTEFGLNADRISVSSQGERQPIASNNSEEGRAQNRRVEIQIN